MNLIQKRFIQRYPIILQLWAFPFITGPLLGAPVHGARIDTTHGTHLTDIILIDWQWSNCVLLPSIVLRIRTNFHSLKTGRVVIVLQGRQAGKKAIIIQNSDTGNKERPYGHCVVAGVQEYPKKVTKKMPLKKVIQRSKVKPFVKVINHRHLLPTRCVWNQGPRPCCWNRYIVNLPKSFKRKISIVDPTKRAASKRNIKKAFEARYLAAGNKWFFQKLRF